MRASVGTLHAKEATVTADPKLPNPIRCHGLLCPVMLLVHRLARTAPPTNQRAAARCYLCIAVQMSREGSGFFLEHHASPAYPTGTTRRSVAVTTLKWLYAPSVPREQPSESALRKFRTASSCAYEQRSRRRACPAPTENAILRWSN